MKTALHKNKGKSYQKEKTITLKGMIVIIIRLTADFSSAIMDSRR